MFCNSVHSDKISNVAGRSKQSKAPALATPVLTATYTGLLCIVQAEQREDEKKRKREEQDKRTKEEERAKLRKLGAFLLRALRCYLGESFASASTHQPAPKRQVQVLRTRYPTRNDKGKASHFSPWSLLRACVCVRLPTVVLLYAH